MTASDSKSEDVVMSFDEALSRTGNGRYNMLLAGTCSLVLMAIAIDLFGFSLVVTAACDLNITVVEKGVLTSLPFAGIFLVSYPWGYVADTRGRRFTLLLATWAGFLLSCLASLAPSWQLLGVIKFFAVCFYCAANSAAYTLMGESCVERVRSKYMLVMTCFLLWGPGAAGILTYPTLRLSFASSIPWLAITFKPWRLLIIVMAIPAGLGAVAIYFFHESPKFLANCGRMDEALYVIKSIYAVNHRCSKDEFKVTSLSINEAAATKKRSLLRAVYEQSAPLFRPPLLKRTLLLFYITAVAYITNNSFLVWLPPILNLVRVAMESGSGGGNVCSLIASNDLMQPNATITDYVNPATTIAPEACIGSVKDNVLITLLASQTIYASLNFVIAWFPNYRKHLLISIIVTSAVSGVLVNLMPEPISSVVFFVLFPCTSLTMGILASFFVDMFPTSYRGMAQCLGLMVGRTSAFVGINIVANLLFNHCELTFYLWSILVLSSALVSWFLPTEKSVTGAAV